MPAKILFVNGASTQNKGCVAIARSAQAALQQCMPDAVFGALLYPSPEASCYKDASFEIAKVSNIAEAMTKLTANDELRQQRCENVRQLATRYDYRKIYDEAFQSAHSNCKL